MGIMSCGIEALSNLAAHLEQLQMLALLWQAWQQENFLENHTKTKSSGVQYQADCCYEQEDPSQA